MGKTLLLLGISVAASATVSLRRQTRAPSVVWLFARLVALTLPKFQVSTLWLN